MILGDTPTVIVRGKSREPPDEWNIRPRDRKFPSQEDEGLYHSAFSHARLMRESLDRVDVALRSDDKAESSIACRILESTQTWQSWESEHSRLMRVVADNGVLRSQAAALRQTTLRLIEGKALFEFLKKNSVRGAERAQTLQHFYPRRTYQHAVIAEHGRYLSKACSFICANHVGTDVVLDPAFLDPMQRYQELYTEYFDLYCKTLSERGKADADSERALLPLLKHQLGEWREMILNPKESAPRVKREYDLRRRLGDTQRLPVLQGRTRGSRN